MILRKINIPAFHLRTIKIGNVVNRCPWLKIFCHFKLAACFLLVCGCLNIVYGQDTIPGGNVHGTWTADDSLHVINGDLTIPDDSTLIIEPGVTVQFQDHYRFDVQGQLLAKGAEGDTITFTSHPDSTEIGWHGLRFNNTSSSNDSSIFEYCKIEYGNANGVFATAEGGAFYFLNFSKARISHSLIRENHAERNGGAIYCSDSDPTFTHNSILNNSSDKHGGGIYLYNSSSKIAHNKIENNKCISFGSGTNDGGGIYIFHSSPEIKNNAIINNSSADFGGGIYSDKSSPTINDNTIDENTSDYGGGLYFSYSTSSIIGNTINDNGVNDHGAGIYSYNSNLTIKNNSIDYNGASSSGGGIFSTSSTMNVINNTINHNHGNAYGGGIYFYQSSGEISKNTFQNNDIGSRGGAIYCSDASPEITHNTIFSNAAELRGGGIHCSYDASPIISHNEISNNNTDGNGGGVACYYNSSPKIVNNTIINNHANLGGGLIFSNNSSPEVINNTITHNTADPYGGGVFFRSQSSPQIINSIIYGNVASEGKNLYISDDNSNPDFKYSNIGGGLAGLYVQNGSYSGVYRNNIDTVPLFEMPTDSAGPGFDGLAGDWSLKCSSPCINSGTPDTSDLDLPAMDIEGNNRIHGKTIDIGAFEFQGINVEINHSNITCYGEEDGTANAEVSYGTPPYSFSWNNGKDSSEIRSLTSGTYKVTVTDEKGCEASASVKVNDPVGYDTVNTCDNYVLPSGDDTLITSGIYTDTIRENGCDSLIKINLTVSSSYSLEDTTLSLCDGDSAFVYGKYRTEPGVYYDSLSTAEGCDSVHSTQVIVNSNFKTSDASAEICEGDSALIYGNYRKAEGTYYDSLLTEAGCDSVHSTYLKVNKNTYLSDTVKACNSYVWNNDTFSTSGTYRDTVSNYTGCDSIMSLNLTITSLDTSVSVIGDSLIANALPENNKNYQWLDCNNNYKAITSATDQTYLPSESGSYALEVTQNGCSDTSACHNITLTSLSQPPNHLPYITVYPNPSEGIFILEHNQQSKSPYEVRDLKGRLIKKGMFKNKHTKLDLSNYESGLYLLKTMHKTIRLKKK